MNYIEWKVVDVLRIMGLMMKLKTTRMRRKSLHWKLEDIMNHESLDQQNSQTSCHFCA